MVSFISLFIVLFYYIWDTVWEDNIRIVLRAIVWEAMNWIHPPQDMEQWQDLVSMVMNLWVP